MRDEDEGMQIPFMNPMQEFGSSILHLTNPHSELLKLENTYRGVIETRDGKLIDTQQPLMNDYGINNVLGSVRSIVNQVTIMGSLEKNDIMVLMDFLGDTLARDLMVNRKAYKINSYAARDKIYFTALTTAFITMTRAKEGSGVLSDKHFWRGSVQELHTKVDNARKGGVLSSLNPWTKT